MVGRQQGSQGWGGAGLMLAALALIVRLLLPAGFMLSPDRASLPTLEICTGQGAMMVKAALNALRLPAGPVRPPLVDATPEQVAQLRVDLAAGGIPL